MPSPFEQPASGSEHTSISASPAPPGEQPTAHHSDPDNKAPVPPSPVQEAQRTGRSPLQNGMVELVLHLLPDDGHPQGRRVRYAISIGGKALVVGGRRVNELFAQCTGRVDLNTDQILDHLEQYIAACQQQIQQALPTKATPSSRPAPRPSTVTQSQQQAPLENTTICPRSSSLAAPAAQPVPMDEPGKPQQLPLF